MTKVLWMAIPLFWDICRCGLFCNNKQIPINIRIGKCKFNLSIHFSTKYLHYMLCGIPSLLLFFRFIRDKFAADLTKGRQYSDNVEKICYCPGYTEIIFFSAFSRLCKIFRTSVNCLHSGKFQCSNHFI